jgi:hypothetical protein
VKYLDVRCPSCHEPPGSVCLGPPWPGKGARSRRPLRFSIAHPSRIALAAALAAGASGAQGLKAARAAVRAGEVAEIPYGEIAREAADTAQRGAIGLYRRTNPPAAGIDLSAPEPAPEVANTLATSSEEPPPEEEP